MTIDEIRTLINEVARSGVAGIKINDKGFSLEIDNVARAFAAEAPPATAAAQPTAVAAQPPRAGAEEPVASEGPATEQSYSGTVASPIVGTFYAAPAPGEKPFVSVGTKVAKGDVLFVIESMKLLNEVTSELDGTVAEILVKDAAPLEFGQPVMRIV